MAAYHHPSLRESQAVNMKVNRKQDGQWVRSAEELAEQVQNVEKSSLVFLQSSFTSHPPNPQELCSHSFLLFLSALVYL